MSVRFTCRTLLVALALAACRVEGGSPTEPDGLELAMARLRWAQTAPEAYQITVSHSCFCPVEVVRPVIVTVRDGQVESRRYAETGAEVDPRFATAFPTVDELFGVIEGAIARHAERVDAVYDPARGFPISVVIDGSADIADDESFYSIRDFIVR
jgi:hypothetical protein